MDSNIDFISSRAYLPAEEESRQKTISSRAELEELQDTGQRFGRWLKGYGGGRPQTV